MSRTKTILQFVAAAALSVVGTVLGVHSGIKQGEANVQHRLQRALGAVTSDSTNSSAADPEIGEPLARGVVSVANAITNSFNDLVTAISSFAKSPEAVEEQDSSRQTRRIIFFCVGAFAVHRVLLFFVDSLQQDQNQQRSTGRGGLPVFGRRPPADLQVESIPATSTNSENCCIICARFPRDCVASCDYGHVFCCFSCAERMVEHAQMNGEATVNCPICRTTVRAFDHLIVC